MALNYGFEVFAIAVDGLPLRVERVSQLQSRFRTSSILVRYDCPCRVLS